MKTKKKENDTNEHSIHSFTHSIECCCKMRAVRVHALAFAPAHAHHHLVNRCFKAALKRKLPNKRERKWSRKSRGERRAAQNKKSNNIRLVCVCVYIASDTHSHSEPAQHTLHTHERANERSSELAMPAHFRDCEWERELKEWKKRREKKLQQTANSSTICQT